MEIGLGVAFTVLVPLLCLGVPGGLVAVLIYCSRRARQRRMAYCAAWAAHHGFHYLPSDPSVLAISRQPPFTSGSGREALDVFRGTFRETHLHCFQYRYRTSDGENTSTHDYQVVAISLPAMRPLLDIAHENSLSRRFDKDLQFENQAFNDRFKIASPSPRFAYDVIHARTMEWMLADPRAHAIRWRFEGSWLMTFRKGPLNPEEVFYYADFLHQVLAQVPKHVWSDP
ncbi:hypothetical protein K3N28_18280 [Glycomyces sp. TRM65418]|uniref:hypothetical protein n=1 Tax=Glycomyces sp. TRM65418 TaxID=2867006 RepID=UPI001CE4E5F4|nr:hypothetical protein [Glycomyces sp. TRM65418]MCC3765010.1 hypothetical protein [Glycomyces sp. TRM65418]QZD54639.1 hypothetical protein K3N28_18190 [Glycomyces sp. TRM65418]